MILGSSNVAKYQLACFNLNPPYSSWLGGSQFPTRLQPNKAAEMILINFLSRLKSVRPIISPAEASAPVRLCVFGESPGFNESESSCEGVSVVSLAQDDAPFKE